MRLEKVGRAYYVKRGGRIGTYVIWRWLVIISPSPICDHNCELICTIKWASRALSDACRSPARATEVQPAQDSGRHSASATRAAVPPGAHRRSGGGAKR